MSLSEERPVDSYRFSNIEAMIALAEALVEKSHNRPIMDLLVVLRLAHGNGECAKSDLVTNLGFLSSNDAVERSLRRLEGEALLVVDYSTPIKGDYLVKLDQAAVEQFVSDWSGYWFWGKNS